jgi:hypothetical protein
MICGGDSIFFFFNNSPNVYPELACSEPVCSEPAELSKGHLYQRFVFAFVGT